MEIDSYLVLHKSDASRKWASNDGYKDQPTRFYEFDSTVKNGSKLVLGTRIFLREDDFLIGTGIITGIDTSTGLKNRHLCPKCSKATLGKTNAGFTCTTCKEHFNVNEITTENLRVLKTRVWYKNTWQFATDPLHRMFVEDFMATKDLQSAIRRVDSGLVLSLMEKIGCSSETNTENNEFNFS